MFRLARSRSTTLAALIALGVPGRAHAEGLAPPADEPQAPAPEAPADAPPPADDAPAEAAANTTTEPAKPATGTLRGTILDGSTGLGLPAATIQASGAPAGDVLAITELDGTYALELPAGTYEVTVSTPEYVTRSRTVTVEAASSVELRLELEPVPVEAGEETIEIVDKIDTRKESAVLAVRRSATVVSDAMSSQEISRTPDSNAGDAMKRVVAVTVQDGKYVALRGLEGRYVTALLNGVLLPSPEPDRNAVPLDLFPTSLLSTMTVMKSYSAELPAQFGGGTLSIDTSSFPTSFELRLGVSTSANTVTTGQAGLTNATAGGFAHFLGFDDGSRALPGAVPRNRPVRGMDAAATEQIGEAMPNVWTPEAATMSPNLGVNVTIGDSTRLGGKRVGYLATAMMRREYGVRDGETGRVAISDGSLTQIENMRYQTGTAEATVGALANVGVDLSSDDELGLLGLYTHVGEDVNQRSFGYNQLEGAELDVTRMQFVERALAFAQLHGKHHLSRPHGLELRWQGNVASTRRDELDSRDLTYTVEPSSGSRQFEDQPGSGQHFWQVLDDLSGGAGADLRVRAGRAQLRAGTLAQLSSRTLGGRRFRYRFMNGGDNAVRTLPGEDMFSSDHIGSSFQLVEDTLNEDAYRASLDIFAGYATAEVPLHDKLRVIGGVRYERSAQELSNGSPFAVAGLATSVARTDDDVLPAANLVYSPRADMNVRAAYSYTLTRPRFRELAPFLFFDYVRRRSISGNPELVTTHIHNADLRWEWFPSEDEVFAVTAFYKQFVDPIEQVLTNVNGNATFENAEGGHLFGGELEARTTLGRITPALRRFRLGTNLAVMRSRVELGGEAMMRLTSPTRPLYGQSPFVVNVNVGWVHPAVADIHVLYNVIGARIIDVGAEGLPDTYERPVHRVDLVAARRLTDDLALKLGVSNLLGQRVRVEQGDVTVNGYSPGVSVSLGLDWTP